jgi:glyoxylase-like metal-dependent hydrolase (beta-lactamase superfamily II)
VTRAPQRTPAPARFQKVSDHYFYLAGSGAAPNLGALVTDDGVLLVDAPPERDAAAPLEALRKVTAKPVRWLVHTRPPADAAEYAPLQGGVLLARRVPGPAPAAARLSFDSQMRLFPGGIEARILALDSKAHTAADVVVFMPAEKVLHVGGLFTPGSYPAIDTRAGGSPVGWLEGARQVIQAVPLLRSAMPPKPAAAPKSAVPPKAPARPPEEKSLEELVAVIPAQGRASNLAELKAVFESAQKLRFEAGRAVAAGRSRETFLASLAGSPFREYGNLESFAAQLFDTLSSK